MTIFRIAAFSGLAMAAALTGCSSGGYDTDQPPSPTATSDYKQSSVAYMPNYMASTSAGRVMTTPEGATVYTFDDDHDGKSSCYSTCAANWPPVIADNSAQAYGRMTLAVRDDGARQWLYDGKPLYTHAEDSMHGDVKGNNVGSVWHVVK